MSQTIGTILKEARRRLGLRVKDVTARTTSRISTSYLSCIENDLRLPSEELLLELAGILGLDKRGLYLEMVRAKAPEHMRDEILAPATPREQRYDELRQLALGDVVDRAADTTRARLEVQRLRRELMRLRRAAAPELQGSGPALRWSEDADRYRMRVEKTVIEASLSIEGDATLVRHVIGLTPRPGRPPIVSVQHTARTPSARGVGADDGFKLIEHPEEVAVELERERIGPDLSLLRILFPEGLGHVEGKDRRVSYSFRSLLLGAYRMATDARSPASDALRDDRGDRGSVVVYVDKPTEELEIDVRFPRFYVPHGIEAWAGTQEFYDAEDNLLEEGVCEAHSLTTPEGDRVILRVRRPLIGMKFAVAWRPLFRGEYEEFRRRLEVGEDRE